MNYADQANRTERTYESQIHNQPPIMLPGIALNGALCAVSEAETRLRKLATALAGPLPETPAGVGGAKQGNPAQPCVFEAAAMIGLEIEHGANRMQSYMAHIERYLQN